MARQVQENFLISFDVDVKQAYQETMKLRGTCRTRVGVIGKTHRFPVFGKGMAVPRVARTPVVPIGASQGYKELTLTDWQAAEYSGIEELDKINYDERRELAKMVASAIGRRSDQLMLDAMSGDTNIVPVPMDLGGSNVFNLDKLLRLRTLMSDNGVPAEGRFIAVRPAVIEQALKLEQVGSVDYNTMRALSSGELNTYAGFRFIEIAGNRKEGGLPETVAGDVHTITSFAWHRDAVGVGIGRDMSIDMDWIPDMRSWLIYAGYTGGACVIDPEGVFKLSSQYSDSGVLP